jgi:holo-[acyl-carrier protein] synthase
MLCGLGLDLVETPRIARALERFGRRFLQRCFTEAETALCLARPHPPRALALRFAAKEAFSKAAGLGMRGLSWREIEVVHDQRGKPGLALHGRAREWARAQEITGIFVSLTDDGDYAAAVVALEK